MATMSAAHNLILLFPHYSVQLRQFDRINGSIPVRTAQSYNWSSKMDTTNIILHKIDTFSRPS